MLALLFTLLINANTQLLYSNPQNNPNQSLHLIESMKSDQECLKLINQNQFGTNCILFVILQNYTQCLNALINYFNQNAIDVYPTLKELYPKHINKAQLHNIIQKLPQHSPSLNLIEPSYLWAQNMTHLLIKIKFTQRLDIPSQNRIDYLDVNITMPQLYLNAYSISSLTRYVLCIETYKFMNPNHYKINEVEQGQIYLEILKSPTPYFWKNIHSDLFYNAPNQYIWWDMYYLYREQLEVAFGLLEDRENQREELEREREEREERLRKSHQQFRNWNEDNNELHIQLYCRNCIPLSGDEWSSWII